MPLLQNPYLRLIFLIAVFLVPFTLARVGLLFAYGGEFAELTVAQISLAMLHGIRFDLSILLLFIGLPLLFLLLPFRWSSSRWWQYPWLWLVFIALVGFIFIIAGDMAYFGFVHRHAGPEVKAMWSDMDLMWDMAISDYLSWLLLFAIFIVSALYAWKRWMLLLPTPPVKVWPRLLVIVVLFFLFVLVIRGGAQYKPIGIANAFSSGSIATGYLTLNGPFAVFHSVMSTKATKKSFMPWPDAVATTRAALFDKAPMQNPAFPLMSQPAAVKNSSTKPNVVVIMLESWDSIHIDSLRKQRGLATLGVTPNFDAISKQGKLYSHFYAAGQRSMDGLAAILAGMPTLPDMPYIGQGLEQSRMSYLGDLAKAEGYQTIFAQSSNRGSFNIDSVAAIAGFNVYLGAEDIPQGEIESASDWGVWDHLMFDEANRRFDELQEPFLGFLFTSSTHNPWRIPDERWKKYPGDSDLDRYLNTLYYADWALGEFFKKAQQSPYYDNTIFIITADHIGRFDVTRDPRSRFHIPLLILAPGMEASVESKVAGQMDLLPTISDLAGWQQPYSALGRSLLSAPEERGLFAVNWKTLTWIEKGGWLSHDLNRRMGLLEGKSQADEMEHSLLAQYQVAVTLMTENRIYKKPEKKD